MKINKLFILLLSLMFVMLSCGGAPFDPRAYNKRPIINNGSGDEELPDGDDEEPEIPGANNPFEDPDNNNINQGGFNGDQIKDWFITAKFLDGNIPVYNFLKSGYSWSATVNSLNENSYVGPPTSAASGGLAPEFTPTYYRSIGKNPKYGLYGSYNTGAHGTRMERFIFYRFTGSAVGQALNNCLIAVDKYTKLVFAYAYPSAFKDVLGNKIPTKWDPIDSGKKYKFYEYDPVGIMKDDGSVIVYEWFKDNQRNNRFDPDRYYWHSYTTVANLAGPGKSPYFVENNTPPTVITIAAKSFKNINVKSLDTTFGASALNYAYLSYAIRSAVYEETKSFDTLAHHNNGDYLGFGATMGNVQKIDKGTTKTFSGSKRYEIIDIKNKTLYIELDSRFIKYNYRFGFPDYGGHATTLTTYENPKIKFKYNAATDAIEIIASESSTTGAVNSDISYILNYDKTFFVRRGETKDFAISYDYTSHGGDEFILTYTISLTD